MHALIDRRLLTAGDTGVEVTHEALLTHWPRLAGWLAEDEQGRALRRHLAPAAAEWDAAGRPDAELYRGARLASALDWVAERDDRLTELTRVERDFLTASRDYADRQLAEETARADRQAGHAPAAALAAASACYWSPPRTGRPDRTAASATAQAQAHRLGALALVTPDLDRSLLLAVQAVRTHDDWETRGDLLAVLGRSPQALRQVRGASDQAGDPRTRRAHPGRLHLVATEGPGGGHVSPGTRRPSRRPASRSRSASAPEAITPGPDPSGVSSRWPSTTPPVNRP